VCLAAADDAEYARHLAASAGAPEPPAAAYLEGLGSAVQRGWDPAGPGPAGDREGKVVQVRLSTRTVAAAHAAVAAMCEGELARMATTLEEDLALQAAAAAAAAAADEAAATAAARMELALTFRIGKKRLLAACAAASRRRARPYTRAAGMFP
jgi:hypothetical protein